MENLINIPGRLHSVAIEQHVAGANEIYDDNQNKLQDEINSILVTNSITNVQYIDGQLRFYNSKGHIVKVISTLQEQSDYAESDSSKVTFIKNKPTIPTKTSDLTNDSGFITDISGKQDVIEDLDDIRAGAQAGATAYQKPQSGIPLTDMSSAVQTSLGKADTALQTETDPTVPSWAKQQNKPSYNAGEVGALPSTTKYGASIDMSLNTTDYKLTLSLKDQGGTVLNSKVVDFPVESMVVNATYDNTNKKIILTLQNGNTIDVPVGDLVNGLQSEITSLNMLDADLVDDTTSAHKFVTAQEKQTWNNKSDFSGSYNDLSDKPTIPDAQIQSDWNQSDNTKKDFIKNKPTIPAAQVQSDWNESDTSSNAYIANKPTIPDISNCIQKSSTPGLVKNDGSIDTNIYLTQHQDISGKADKVSGATNGNFAALDSNGNLTDSGHKHSDYLTSHQDLSNYVQKSQTAGLLKNDGTVDTTQYLSQHQDISGKEDITPIEVVASGTTAINAAVNTYYEVAGEVGALAITLPTPTDLTKVAMVVVHLTAGTTPNVVIGAVDNPQPDFAAAYDISASKEYEINCLYNGDKWVVADMEVV